MLALGVALLGVGWLAWTGRYRAWAGDPHTLAIPTALLPPLGLVSLGVGLAALVHPVVGALLFVPGLILAVPGLVIGIWDPRWFRPRWDREERERIETGPDVGARPPERKDPAERPHPPARPDPADELRAFGGQEWLGHWRATRAGEGAGSGRLAVYEGGLVFRPERRRGDAGPEHPAEDGVVTIPADRITALHAAGSHLVVQTVDGTHAFEVRRPERRVRKIARILGR